MIKDAKNTKIAIELFLEKNQNEPFMKGLTLLETKAWFNPRFPWATCTPDAVLISHDKAIQALVEVKTSKDNISLNSASEQMQRGMLLLGVNKTILVMYNTTRHAVEYAIYPVTDKETILEQEFLEYANFILK